MSDRNSKPVSLVIYLGRGPKVVSSAYEEHLGVIRCCAEHGWRTYVVWSDMPEDPALARPFTEVGCQIILLPRPSAQFSPGNVLRTFRMLQRVRCDVFHCFNIHTSPLIAAGLARVPVRIWSKWSMSPYYERATNPKGLHRMQASIRTSCRLAHRVLPIASAVRDELLDLGIQSDTLVVTQGTVNVPKYTHASPTGVRETFGLSDADTVLTTVGHALPVKGWDVLIRAFAKMTDRVPSARLLLVGGTDGDDEIATAQALRRLAEELGVGEKIRFAGRCPGIAEILAASDVYVMPSRSEGDPLALKEALASGLPCVAARVGGIPEVIAHGENGLLFDREDVDGLTGRLVELLGNDGLRQTLGASARASVQRFSLERAAQDRFDLY